MVFRTSATLALLATLVTSSFASDTLTRRTNLLSPMELMANDKEEKSILIKSSDQERVQTELGDLSVIRPQLTAVAKALASSIFEQPVACELDAFKTLRLAARAQGLPAEFENMATLLAALRMSDLIDDVVLAPLWKALPAYQHAPQLSKIQNSIQDSSAEFERAKTLFAGADSLCPTAIFSSVATQLRTENGKYKKARLVQETKTALRLKVISPELASWINDLADAGWENMPFSLAKISSTLKAVKNVYLQSDQHSEKTDFASQKKEKGHGLTNRMAFYQKYNPEQIDFLTKAFYQFLLNDQVKKLTITAYSDDGSIVDQSDITSPTERHRWALNRLHKEFADVMARSSIFAGANIVFEDLVLAALETGTVIGTPSRMDTIMTLDDSWNPPKEKGLRRILKTVTRYGSPLLLLVPPPYNVISSIGLTLLQTVILKDKKQPDPLQEGYSIF